MKNGSGVDVQQTDNSQQHFMFIFRISNENDLVLFAVGRVSVSEPQWGRPGTGGWFAVARSGSLTLCGPCYFWDIKICVALMDRFWPNLSLCKLSSI